MHIQPILWVLPLILFSDLSLATTVRGRFTVGVFRATERFQENTGGSDKNDSQFVSTRLYLKVSEIKKKNWDVIFDLRDKNDFFDKPDRERLTLTARNSFQVRELDSRYAKGRYVTQLGRFPVQEAGAVGVDGGLLKYRHSRDTSSSIFAGLNPKRDDQYYYQFNPKDRVFGLLNTYQTLNSSLVRNLYFSHAIVGQAVGSEIDRVYLFHNAIYQWNPSSRLISLLYLDTVPRTFVQNGNILWQQGWNPRWSSQLSLLAVDVITYSRRQGIREKLAPSPFKEIGLRADYASTPRSKWQFGISDGKRDADRLSKAEFYVGLEKNQIWTRHWDVFAKAGGRKNFTSDDLFSNVYLGYFARKWEVGLDAEYGIEKYKDGVTKHPITLELDISNNFSRSLFLASSFQAAKDETVQIMTGFLKLGYRFGAGEAPPLRDGSPPRGQL